MYHTTGNQLIATSTTSGSDPHIGQIFWLYTIAQVFSNADWEIGVIEKLIYFQTSIQ